MRSPAAFSPMAGLVLTVALALVSSAAGLKTFITHLSASGNNSWAVAAAPNCYATPKACFGASYLGGNQSVGSITQVAWDGRSVKTIYSFDVFKGLTPSLSPILLSDNRTLVGCTSQGGAYGSGLVYAFDIITETMTTLAAFDGAGGSTPQAPPVQVGNSLYGIAGQGGAYGFGVVWSLELGGNASKVTVLHNFEGGEEDCATPFGSPTYNPSDGKLYGMAFSSAANDMGGIFSLQLDGSEYQLLASFNPETGGGPQMGSLILSKDGFMYGNGWVGGANKLGSIFRFDPVTANLTAVFSFTLATGTQPYNSPGESQSGKWLYVVTWHGGKNNVGTILALSKDGSKRKVLLQLEGPKTGGTAMAGVTVRLEGTRIITAMGTGGKYGLGTLLSLPIPIEYR